MTREELTQAVARGYIKATAASPEQAVNQIVGEVQKELDKLDDELFDRIWEATKHWDLDNGRTIEGTDITGYSGMTGNDVRVIMAAIAGNNIRRTGDIQ